MPKKQKPTKSPVKIKEWFLSWDKSSVAAMIANALTLIALYFTFKQNVESDSTSKIEQKRVNVRDSVQLTTFLNSFKSQQEEYLRLREIDSANIALYKRQINIITKSLIYQNEDIEIKRLSNKSFLSLNIKIPNSYVNTSLKYFTPTFIVNNLGRIPADLVSLKTCFITEETWGNDRKIGGSIKNHSVKGISLKPDSTLIESRVLLYGGNVIIESNRDSLRNYLIGAISTTILSQIPKYKNDNVKEYEKNVRKYFAKISNKMNSLDKIYPINPYSFYLICQLKYRDNLQYGINELYTIHKLNYYSLNKDSIRFIMSYVDSEKLVELKPITDKAKFDFRKLKGIVPKESTFDVFNLNKQRKF